jgi:NAD(P)-dependent dehydrogenase (short-subunit alcohol dehydrogenase family)
MPDLEGNPMINERVLWVTGGGSGVGRAVAQSAAAAGWVVAVSGRRDDSLRDTVGLIEKSGGSAIALPLDVHDSPAITAARDAILERYGRIDALVLGAGQNSPERQWGDQDMQVFEDIVRTNLLSTAFMVDAALPELRQHQGVVVVISSFAGWQFQPRAGVAYSASKSALSSITRTLNEQEAPSGVRACHLCPGDIDTDFLNQRPTVPDAAARAVMLTPVDVAASVQFVLDVPSHVRVDELVISPISQR